MTKRLDTPKEPFRVRCGKCEHKWIAAYTPMVMETMGELLKSLRCPMCGNDSNTIFLDLSKANAK
jgi:hypothetical protein